MAVFLEGDVFAIPLRDNSDVIGLIARVKRNNVGVLAYLFSPRVEHGVYKEACSIVQSRSVIDVVDVATTELRRGKWPIVAKIPGWIRSDWPVPTFLYQSGQLSIRSQDDYEVEIRRDGSSVVESCYRYVIYGAGALRIKLEQRFVK